MLFFERLFTLTPASTCTLYNLRILSLAHFVALTHIQATKIRKILPQDRPHFEPVQAGLH